MSGRPSLRFEFGGKSGSVTRCRSAEAARTKPSARRSGVVRSAPVSSSRRSGRRPDPTTRRGRTATPARKRDSHSATRHRPRSGPQRLPEHSADDPTRGSPVASTRHLAVPTIRDGRLHDAAPPDQSTSGRLAVRRGAPTFRPTGARPDAGRPPGGGVGREAHRRVRTVRPQDGAVPPVDHSRQGGSSRAGLDPELAQRRPTVGQEVAAGPYRAGSMRSRSGRRGRPRQRAGCGRTTSTRVGSCRARRSRLRRARCSL